MSVSNGRYDGWAVEIYDYNSCMNTRRMFSWVKSQYLIFIPKLQSGDIVARFKKTFKVPVEELMTISGFTIERKIK